MESKSLRIAYQMQWDISSLMQALCCRRNGKFTGFPVMGIRWQRMESESLRTAYKMKKGQKGILVRHIQPTYEAAQHLKADDIIMRFDDTPVASDGTVPFRYDFITQVLVHLYIIHANCMQDRLSRPS